ncbi:hypothetical protein [Marinimicrobium koreense]|uniref:hypothetical protein n=1 Tax=Marinimicrobium koreense TaxID=306545 RepID=UPI003F72898B
MKNVLIGVGGVAAVGVCVGIWYAIDSVDRSELPEWLGGEATEFRVEQGERPWEHYVLAEELSEQEFMVWPGKLECDAWHRWDGFTRDKELLVSDEMIAYDSGEVQKFVDSTGDGTMIPAQLSARFEWWRGHVNGTTVVMEGWYTAVNDDLKRLSMSGVLTDGELYLEGERGPRTCRITAVRPN